MKQTTVDGYPVDPGTYCRFVPEAIDVLPDFNEYFLYCIVSGLLLPIEITLAQPEHLRVVLMVDRGELFFFSHAVASFLLFLTKTIAVDRT